MDRFTLHKTKLEEFKEYCNDNGIAYRDGKGNYQVLQVMTTKGWKVIYKRDDMPEHFTVDDNVMPIVREYLQSKK